MFPIRRQCGRQARRRRNGLHDAGDWLAGIMAGGSLERDSVIVTQTTP